MPTFQETQRLVPIYHITRSNIPEDRNMNDLCQEKLIPHNHAVYSESGLYEHILSKKIFLRHICHI
jgi:hypothetical protein